MKNNKFRVGELVTCIKNYWYNDKLITVGKEYTVLCVGITKNYIEIMSDINHVVHLPEYLFISKRVLRKNKLIEINEKQQI